MEDTGIKEKAKRKKGRKEQKANTKRKKQKTHKKQAKRTGQIKQSINNKSLCEGTTTLPLCLEVKASNNRNTPITLIKFIRA